MPRLRRLSGKELISIFAGFGFEIYSQSGSHIRLQRIVDGKQQRILIAVHGKKTIKPATLMNIYRTAKQYISEEEIKKYFYTD